MPAETQTRRKTQRSSSSAKTSTSTIAGMEEKDQGSAGSGADTPGSSATTRTAPPRGNPLDFDPGAWTEPDDAPPVRTAADFDDPEDYGPPPPELIDWTPERAGFLVRGAGYALHTVDPVSKAPGGETLWRATEADCQEIGAPLSRILNRYAPARRLAGYSDEAELVVSVLAYTRRELAMRGRIVADLDQPAEDPGDPLGGAGWSPTQVPE